MQSVTQHPAARPARPETEAAAAGPTPTVPPPARPAEARNYNARLRAELGQLIDQLELSPLQQRCLRARWLDTVLWMEGRATHARNRYYLLRLLIPALISLDLAGSGAVVLNRHSPSGLPLDGKIA